MRGKLVKKLRKKVYRDDSPRERTYVEKNGTTITTGKRKQYKLLKNKIKNVGKGQKRINSDILIKGFNAEKITKEI